SAARAGLRAGDVLETLNGYAIASTGDVMYALHRGPAKGKVAALWQRGGKTLTAELELAEGWRKTNLTWRTSMLNLLTGLTLLGDALTAEEKKALGLGEKRLAFRQESPVARDAREAGVQPDDVIIGIDGQELEMTMRQFLAHVRRNYLVGDRIK